MMRSRTDVVENGRQGSLVVEVSGGTSRNPMPDPEVPARAKRRRFKAQYKRAGRQAGKQNARLWRRLGRGRYWRSKNAS